MVLRRCTSCLLRRVLSGVAGAGERLDPDHVWVPWVGRKDLTPGALAPGPGPLDTDPLHCRSSPRPVRRPGASGEWPWPLARPALRGSYEPRPAGASPESACAGGIFRRRLRHQGAGFAGRRSYGSPEDPGDGLRLIGLWPVRGALDLVQLGAAEQAGEMPGELGAEVFIPDAVHEQDGHVEPGELAAGDAAVLLGERAEQRPGPGPDRGQRVGYLAFAEELREDREHPDSLGVERVEPEPAGGVRQQPQALAGVVDHGVGERCEVLVGEQADHLGELEPWGGAVVGVHEDQPADAAGVIQRDVTGAGSSGCT